jgi:DNA-dependent RNA polymerase auxiliary subunit epsilon
LLLLIAGILPAFLGESHFAFLGYAKNFRQTPVRRELDYLRVLGGSREAAKELKLFGLKNFLIERFTRLSDQHLWRKCRSGPPPADCRIFFVDDRHGRLLLRVCVRDLADGNRVPDHRHAHFSDRRHHAGEQQYPANFLDSFEHRRPGLVPHRLACVF